MWWKVPPEEWTLVQRKEGGQVYILDKMPRRRLLKAPRKTREENYSREFAPCLNWTRPKIKIYLGWREGGDTQQWILYLHLISTWRSRQGQALSPLQLWYLPTPVKFFKPQSDANQKEEGVYHTQILQLLCLPTKFMGMCFDFNSGLLGSLFLS